MIKINPVMRPCDCENIGDFSRYYRFAWVTWHNHPRDGIAPVHVREVGANAIVLTDLDRGVFTVQGWERIQQEISFGCPALGMVNTDHTILYLSQTAPRQPHRGYRANGVVVTGFNSWSTRKVLPAPQSGDAQVIKRLFLPEFYEPREALGLLDKGDRIGCALSPLVGLYTSSEAKHPSIAYRRHTIGYVEDNRRAYLTRPYLNEANSIQKALGIEVSIL